MGSVAEVIQAMSKEVVVIIKQVLFVRVTNLIIFLLLGIKAIAVIVDFFFVRIIIRMVILR